MQIEVATNTKIDIDSLVTGLTIMQQDENVYVIYKDVCDKAVQVIEYLTANFACEGSVKTSVEDTHSCKNCRYLDVEKPHTCDLCTSLDNDEDYSFWTPRIEEGYG